MSSFHYIALSQAGKELSGVIEATDEAGARTHLNELGFSVIELNVVPTGAALAPAAVSQTEAASSGSALSTTAAGAPAASKISYEFEALDRKGKAVSGTIVSDSAVKAYTRLTEEYQLQVNYLADSGAAQAQKDEARLSGIQTIRMEYEKLHSKQLGKIQEEEKKLAQEQAMRKDLLDLVDFTMKKIQGFLGDSGQELKTEERDAIQGYLNQLMRIKDSTNLEHIRSTCERMLDHIQKQELFLHEELKLRESAKLKVETRALLTQLKHTGLQQDIDVAKSASRWEENPLLRPFAHAILRFMHLTNPEVRSLKEQIKTINRQLTEYLKMMVLGGGKGVRQEAFEGWKNLHEQKKRLALQIEAIIVEERRAEQAQRPPSLFWENAGMIFGWVLSFYLAVYIISYPFTIKQFPGTLPKNFYFYSAKLSTAAAIFFFLGFAAITARNYWLKKHWAGPLLLYPAAAFCFLLFLVNLL